MSIHFKGLEGGYDFDIVNGLHKAETAEGYDGSYDLFPYKEVDRTNEKIRMWMFAASGIMFALTFLVHLPLLVPAILLAALGIGWSIWSNNACNEYLTIDEETRFLKVVDPRARFLIGYGKVDEPFIQVDNRLGSLVNSSRGIPQGMTPSTCYWKCTDMTADRITFEIHIGDYAGGVAFWKKLAPDAANIFGDPDRYDFRMVGDQTWELVCYRPVADRSAGVSWT